MFINLPYYLIALPFVIIIRIIWPFIKIRFGPIRNDVIGHFAFDTEYYLSERAINNSETIDLFFFQSRNSPNIQWELMVKRFFKTHILFKYCNNINCLFPGWEKHYARLQDTGSRDTKNIFIKTNCQLAFTSQELDLGKQYLKEIGMKPNQNFVCMIARDSAYKENFLSINNYNKDWSIHNYRDSNIFNYVKAAESLTKLDYFVFRIGKAVKGKIETNNKMIVDYSNSKYRSDFLDIFLSTNCSFFINGEAGLSSVPEVFRVPIVFVNCAAIETLFTWNSNIITIPKKYWIKGEKRFMTFREIYTSGAGRFLKSEQYENMGIELIENTSDEILDVSTEMYKRLHGIWETNEEDENLQICFWSLFPKSELHGKIYARIGADFLRQNRGLLT
jgi:putative glycosyltransferase (TIGR04372 family)